jgi:hypothetical protein
MILMAVRQAAALIYGGYFSWSMVLVICLADWWFWWLFGKPHGSVL